MKRQTTRKYFGEELLQVGDLVQMAVPDADRGKADYHNDLTVVKHADKTLLGLNTVTDIWKELPT